MKNALKHTGLAIGVGIFLAFLGVVFVTAQTFVAISSPQLEEIYIRQSVGTQVVKVAGKRGTGTGFYVKFGESNLIMTNKHVCALKSPKGNLFVIENGTTEKIVRQVLFESQTHDICLLEGDNKKHGLSLANHELLEGLRIYIVGHPSGQALTVSYGFYIGDETISIAVPAPIITKEGVTIYLPFIKSFETNKFHAYSRPGSSGSPITNVSGDVVALLFAGSRGDNKQTYGVPLNYLKEALNEYERSNK